jgi:hypothetical protein
MEYMGKVLVYQRPGEDATKHSGYSVLVRDDLEYVVIPAEMFKELRTSCARKLLRWLKIERLVLG